MPEDDTKIEVTRDLMDPARAEALRVTLEERRPLADGDPLPPFFHQAYFWSPKAPDALGRDGHPKVGGLIPDMGLPRRMWAGGRLFFYDHLRLGSPAERRSTCISTARKLGRSGPLGFVTLRHEFHQNGRLCIVEEQDLVYRDDPGATGRPAAQKTVTVPAGATALDVSSTLLFRYSALTFNGHRIHYDADYARAVEGYPDLVVHGPLLAQRAMLAVETARGPLAQFEFRGRSPLCLGEPARLWLDAESAMIATDTGRVIMEACFQVHPTPT